jgi:aspartate/methionine/tyrosine aminotransferase
VSRNLDALRRAVRRAPVLSTYEPEGGWSAVVRVPAILSEEQWMLRLLDTQGVLVHPGYFFDLNAGAHLVISLLPEPDVFETGASRLADLALEIQS